MFSAARNLLDAKRENRIYLFVVINDDVIVKVVIRNNVRFRPTIFVFVVLDCVAIFKSLDKFSEVVLAAKTALI